MDSAALRILANSGALHEISNSEDGDGIERQIRASGSQGGHVKDGVTRKAVLFVVYQTGRHGPQNGFRLALVLEGARGEDAREHLKGAGDQAPAADRVVGP